MRGIKEPGPRLYLSPIADLNMLFLRFKRQVDYDDRQDPIFTYCRVNGEIRVIRRGINKFFAEFFVDLVRVITWEYIILSDQT